MVVNIYTSNDNDSYLDSHLEAQTKTKIKSLFIRS